MLYANQRRRYCIGSTMVSPSWQHWAKFAKQFIRFYENERKYKLQGINSPPPQIVSSNRMEKMIKKGAQAYFLHCFAMEESTKEDTVTPIFCTHVHGAKSKGVVHYFRRQYDLGPFFFSFLLYHIFTPPQGNCNK